MRIATWNVNSVRARLPSVLPWIAEVRPDVLCLQETKCADERFPREAFEELGYNVAFHGQKTYNGVALLARERIEDVRRGFPGDEEGVETRLIGAAIGDLLVVNAYAINGQKVGAPRYYDKLAWYERLRALLAERYDLREKIVVAGDFNVTFDDRDVHDPERWREQILCSTPERQALASLVSLGYADPLRKFTDEPGHHTWWDFRTRAFERDWGLRIDHLLMSPPALAACTSFEVDLRPRRGERPSDHAPVVATLE